MKALQETFAALANALYMAQIADVDREAVRLALHHHHVALHKVISTSPAPPAEGPGSVSDERKALLQLLDAMPDLAPNATGLSHAMGLILARARATPQAVQEVEA